MTMSLGRAAGLLAFAFPAIFWEDTELSFSRLEGALHFTPGATCCRRDPHCELGEGAQLSSEAPNASHSLPH